MLTLPNAHYIQDSRGAKISDPMSKRRQICRRVSEAAI
jgi:hypothetical protein